jgi:2-hydroxychromene-2-carboxylate isomerase
MRGLPVPAAKRMYIVRDAARCARALGIPFGRIHDPVGAGALRLLTAFPREADPTTQLRWCAVAGQSVWAEGLAATRDAVIANIATRSGADPRQAAARLAAGIDTAYAEANRTALVEAGLWGVPSFRLGGFTTWGQDRIWMIDALLARAGSAGPPGTS